MPKAHASTILVFGQVGIGSNFTATNNGQPGASGGTVLSAVDIPIIITGIDNSSPLPVTYPFAYLNLNATSNSTALFVPGPNHVTQSFSGFFTITSGLGGTGTNYLSGLFSDSVFGNGTGLTMAVSSDPSALTFTSDVIGLLGAPRGMSLALSNVTPTVARVGLAGQETIRAFNSNVAGNFSAVPEPTSVAMLGLGLSGMIVMQRLMPRKSPA